MSFYLFTSHQVLTRPFLISTKSLLKVNLMHQCCFITSRKAFIWVVRRFLFLPVCNAITKWLSYSGQNFWMQFSEHVFFIFMQKNEWVHLMTSKNDWTTLFFQLKEHEKPNSIFVHLNYERLWIRIIRTLSLNYSLRFNSIQGFLLWLKNSSWRDNFARRYLNRCNFVRSTL
jgi:hypothetical protein